MHLMLSNYQMLPSGGDGWLRVLKFRPSEKNLEVRTYSRWLEKFDPNRNSRSTWSLILISIRRAAAASWKNESLRVENPRAWAACDRVGGGSDDELDFRRRCAHYPHRFLGMDDAPLR